MFNEIAKQKFIAVKKNDELRLLEEFVFELTVAGRAVCLSETISRDKQLSGLKQINEINFRVLNIILQIQKGEIWPNKKGTWDMISNRVKREPNNSSWVESAMIRSLQSLKDKSRLKHEILH
jgi:hypothetical protein